MTDTHQKIYQKIVELAKQQGKDATSLRFQDSIPDFGSAGFARLVGTDCMVRK